MSEIAIQTLELVGREVNVTLGEARKQLAKGVEHEAHSGLPGMMCSCQPVSGRKCCGKRLQLR